MDDEPPTAADLDTAFFERMVETVGVGVGIYGEDGRFRYVNQAYADLFETTTDDLVGTALWEIAPDFERGRFDDYWTSFAEGDTRTAETTHEFDGVSVPVETTTTRGHIDGEPYNFGTIADITERKRREAELRRQNERLDSFVGVVSHDLRNPLNVAQGYLDILRAEVDRDEVELVDSALTRMETLIEDLLTVARGGDPISDLEPVRLDEVARAAWQSVDTDEATIEVKPGDHALAADPGRLQQLLENLFRNGVDHAGEDVTVTVGALEGGGFYVADDGPGIDPEVHDQMFEAGVTGDDGGTGLGLLIVSEIAEAHDWQTVAIESDDGGARFEFRVE
ncbi:sensor histidine kinase [Halobaculum limi]|uniref:sensor histidine kinase n=1 Tax=Halobaculum limi TaxID=3031916 RepID=UPI002406659D|nr:PAS domain-containing sensor histidine kinase [Halobaculum sp. YSMS11]